MKIRLFIILFVLISPKLFAQFFETGNEPFGTKWRQINTEKFRIIFPSEAEKVAIRYANLLNIVDSISPRSLQSSQRKFDVVVHNHSVLSNGFVAWAPKRMEIIAQPPVTTPAQPWLTQLAVHETRHTSQLFKLNGGIIKPLSFVLGEQAVGGSAGFVPSWFFEGDAVAFETAITNSGRGRQADFYQYYRAHFLSQNNTFKYDKFLLGSYRDNIPNQYNFGYQIVSYAKVNYGNDVWANTLRFVSRYPFTIFPFYFGLKAQTGLSRKGLFEKTFKNLDSTWRGYAGLGTIRKYESINAQAKEYSEYRYPCQITDGSYIAYKSTLSKNPRFVKIDRITKKEVSLIQTGYLTSNPAYSGDNIFYTEYKPHIRWEYKSYSIVKCFNIKKGELKTISDNGRYFSPAFSPNDKLVYVISSSDDGCSAIVAFDLNGKIILSFTLPIDIQPFELSYNLEKEELIIGAVTNEGKSLYKFGNKGSLDLIFGPTYRDIHSIFSMGDVIYFSTTEGYKEDIFALNSLSRQIYRITNSEFGATDPSLDKKNNEILFANYCNFGYGFSSIPIDTTSKEIEFTRVTDDAITRKLRSSEKFNIDSVQIPEKLFVIENYNRIRRLVNVHSWAPFYYDVNQLTVGEVAVKPGVTIYSQSLTGTSTLTAGYGYDSTHLVHINYRYSGFFPVISLDFILNSYSPTVFKRENTDLPKTDKQHRKLALNLYLPFKLSEGCFISNLYPIVQLVNENHYFFSTSDSLYHKGFNKINYRLYFSSTQRGAHKDIRPRLGVEAEVNYTHAPFNKNNIGSLAAGKISVYLPGIGLNHSMLLKSSVQQQFLKNYYLSNYVAFPRGYINFGSERFKSFSAEYLMPIAYPDLALGSIAYFKRISLNAFFDYGINQFPTQTGDYKYEMKTYGIELFTDLNLFRTRYPIRAKYQFGLTGNNFNKFGNLSFYIDFYGQ